MASSKREKELARQRAERQAARRAAAERKRKQRNAIIAAVVAVLLVAGIGTAAALSLGGDDDGTDTATPEVTASSEPTAPTDPNESAAPSAAPSADPSAAAGPCSYTSTGDASREVELPPATGELAQQAGTATISTDRGNITIDLLEAEAPCTVNSFASLAQQAYFSDTPCHRLVVSSGLTVLQCGDPSGTGTGGPGYAFADENLEGATYPRGTVAMANAGPGTNGSQFFLVTQDSTALDPLYTPFGVITEGLDILDTVVAAGAAPPGPGGNTAPNLPVQIAGVTVAPPS